MRVEKHDIGFDIDAVVREEVPFMDAYHRHNGILTKNVQELLEFPVNNSSRMPFYTIREDSCVAVGNAFEAYYAMMHDALQKAFRNQDLIDTFFDCAFLRKHGKKFVPYAKHTFMAKHPALYGRFDARFNPETEQVDGVYEFNGDTPVMLFESVNLQARLSQQLSTEQYNNWWHNSIKSFQFGLRNFAVVCDTSYVDDLATCDTIAQMMSEARVERQVSMLDFDDLDFDHANLRKPFIAKHSGQHLDGLYVLSPWEEMIENFPAMLNSWERWVDSVTIFEPAWRWFMSHKGMLALCTYLMESDASFVARHASVPLLKTYLEKPSKGMWVEKPVLGRLSNNIRIWDGNTQLSDTGGYYPEERSVFQEYAPPHQVPGRNNFIMCMWMSCTNQFNREVEAATLCMREFDEQVLSLANERFIPHIVV